MFVNAPLNTSPGLPPICVIVPLSAVFHAIVARTPGSAAPEKIERSVSAVVSVPDQKPSAFASALLANSNDRIGVTVGKSGETDPHMPAVDCPVIASTQPVQPNAMLISDCMPGPSPLFTATGRGLS